MQSRSLIAGAGLGLVAGALLQRGALPLALVAAGLAGAVSVNLIQAALWPSRLEAVRFELEQRLLRCTLIGTLALLSGVWVVLGLTPPLRGLVFLLLMAGLLGLALAGWPAALASLVGRRLAPHQAAPRQIVAGTVVGALSLLVPLLGWLLALGLALAGLGASLVTLRLPRWELAAHPAQSPA